MLVVNFFAGPGAGKSTLAAGLFSYLKMKDYNAELVQEHAKEWAWEKRPIYCQAQVFGEQLARQERLKRAGLEVIVTDSPLLQSLAYVPESYPYAWNDVVIGLYKQFDNINFFIERTKKFNPEGRYHNLEQSQKIDQDTIELLESHNIPFLPVQVHNMELITNTVELALEIRRAL